MTAYGRGGTRGAYARRTGRRYDLDVRIGSRTGAAASAGRPPRRTRTAPRSGSADSCRAARRRRPAERDDPHQAVR
ncbi:hypothetical protein [Streptomyces sp. NPDC058335]|uniref:hypothetical protein n=1 Tax=Streptomyces sp. NPDC058335 TaxID=3346451 RepID=UPI0036464270